MGQNCCGSNVGVENQWEYGGRVGVWWESKNGFQSVVSFLICDGPFELKFKEVSPILGGGCGILTDF